MASYGDRKKFDGKYYVLREKAQSKSVADVRAKYHRRVLGRQIRIIDGGRSKVTGKQVWDIWARGK